MRDLSLHILDIVENSITAGADFIEICLDENMDQNRLILEIRDNGSGLDERAQALVLDPFYTSKPRKKIGLGLPLLAQAAREAEGSLTLESGQGIGTTVRARFVRDHIDRKPLGDLVGTLIHIIATNGQKVDLEFEHCLNSRSFSVNTRHIKQELEDVPITNHDVLAFLRRHIFDGLQEIEKAGG
jgi:anti-sigma regulatory factor (Ser/Thr protein kinase)